MLIINLRLSKLTCSAGFSGSIDQHWLRYISPVGYFTHIIVRNYLEAAFYETFPTRYCCFSFDVF